MAPTRLAAPPTCLSCMRRLVQPSPSTFFPLRPLAQQQTRGAGMNKKNKQEDTQGIPVRLLHDMPGFGAKDSIMRVPAGRMRNQWFPNGQAEYMTKKRFQELQLTEAAIGARDRTFGTISLVGEDEKATKAKKRESKSKAIAKETIVLTPHQSLTLLQTHLPKTLTFVRKPIQPAAPPPSAEPTPMRSPLLARHAQTSGAANVPEPEPLEAAPVAIFGSVSSSDILAVIKEKLLESDPANGGRIALDASGIEIEGLEEGEDRIKHLGTFKVSVSTSKDVESVNLEIKVISE